ncbi:MAG: hypothetical protein ABIA77_00420 [Candidatus Omnitrophota bacterium]
MKIIFLKSFDKAYSKVSSGKQEQIDKTIEKLVYYLGEREAPMPKGIGMEKRKGGYGYCRVDIHLRVVFKEEKDALIFYLVGTHKQVETYIKNLSR